jgi:hypothetical protein
MELEAKNNLEELLLQDNDLLQGLNWGQKRRGHPETYTWQHVKEIWSKVYRIRGSESVNKEILRFIALLHDSFYHHVDPDLHRGGENHHGYYAQEFAKKYLRQISKKYGNLAANDIIQTLRWHDEPFAISLYMFQADYDRHIYAENRLNYLLTQPIYNWYQFATFIWLDGHTAGKKSISPYCFINTLIGKGLISMKEWYAPWAQYKIDDFFQQPQLPNLK